MLASHLEGESCPNHIQGIGQCDCGDSGSSARKELIRMLDIQELWGHYGGQRALVNLKGSELSRGIREDAHHLSTISFVERPEGLELYNLFKAAEHSQVFVMLRVSL